MLFNSFEFLFFFLPITLVLFIKVASRWGNEAAISVLVFASLMFYSWWNPIYLPLLLFSMFFNFWFGRKLGASKSKGLLTVGIVVNLGLLGYFKYSSFFLNNVNTLLDLNWPVSNMILPLAISFFTFQQIAYLVDSYRGITQEYNFRHYALFVSFFPQLIAGPIVHHKEMLPQFERTAAYKLDTSNLIIGMSIFAIGLFKKTVIADGIAVYANPVFAAADSGESIDLITAWGGALAYTFQLYFDFSGYSDMAIGLARIFGIVLPLNFYSPYKSANIAEFWRRWHMTLSRFLRDYVYIPLGGNRKGRYRRYVNLIATMLLGGLWHGAGWNFVIWGALHGAYLAGHQVWRGVLEKLKIHPDNSRIYVFFAWLLTFIVVIVGWVFFRATTYDGAILMLQGMFGFSDVALPNAIISRLGSFGVTLNDLGIVSSNSGGSTFVLTWLWIAVLLPCVLLLPNTQDLFSNVNGSLSKLKSEINQAFWPMHHWFTGFTWQDSTKWAVLTALALGLGCMTLMQVSEFLYFQF